MKDLLTYCGNCGALLQDLNQPYCLNCGIPLRKVQIDSKPNSFYHLKLKNWKKLNE